MSEAFVTLIIIIFIAQTVFLALDIAVLSGFKEITRSCKTDLAGWAVLEYVLFVAVIVLFLAGRTGPALAFLVAHVILTFRAKHIRSKRIYEDLKAQGKLDLLEAKKPE